MTIGAKTIRAIIVEEVKKRRADGLIRVYKTGAGCGCELRYGLFPCDSPAPECALARRKKCETPDCECGGRGHLSPMTFELAETPE